MAFHLNPRAGDGREGFEDVAKARYGILPVWGAAGLIFFLGRFGAFDGVDDAVAFGRGFFLFIDEKQGGELTSHVVLDVIGQHADENVCADSVVEAVVDGSDV